MLSDGQSVGTIGALDNYLSVRPSVDRGSRQKEGLASLERPLGIFIPREDILGLYLRTEEKSRSVASPAPRDPIEPSVSYRRQAFAKNEQTGHLLGFLSMPRGSLENLVDVPTSPSDPSFQRSESSVLHLRKLIFTTSVPFARETSKLFEFNTSTAA